MFHEILIRHFLHSNSLDRGHFHGASSAYTAHLSALPNLPLNALIWGGWGSFRVPFCRVTGDQLGLAVPPDQVSPFLSARGGKGQGQLP